MKLPFLLLFPLCAAAQPLTVVSPDGNLAVELDASPQPTYTVTYRGHVALDASPLGLTANFGDLSQGLTLTGHDCQPITDDYTLTRAKTAEVHYRANELKAHFQNAKKQQLTITFRVSNNDVAFRYELPVEGGTRSVRVMSERTGYRFPAHTTTFLCPQSDAMIGWKRTKPSYEEEYRLDRPMDEPSQYGHGYTFPCLFKVPADTALWVLLSETGTDSRYCGCRLTDFRDGLYRIAFPMAEENNGNGTAEPAFALPGQTPWRTITVGETLAPIVETTAPFDNVAPRFTSQHKYKMGRGTWSWIVWQDNSINVDDQRRFVDLAKAMGYEYVLIDNWWDTNIGTRRMEELVQYAHQQGIDVFLWYSSSGYWNDIEQGPTNRMTSSIERKKWMRWMQSLGVKGMKIDFFGGDKQETLRLYEDILSDADDHGLMVIFHGCTIPRGWERMYPNYVGSEAVLASENMVFNQHFCDLEAQNACLHPFLRNTIGSMEFGGTFMNRHLAKGNTGGRTRVSTDCLELATAVLFQNAIQHFALTPENLEGAPRASMDFLRRVPTEWDETRFIAGYPGRYVVLARRHGTRWYIAGVNAASTPLSLKLDLSRFAPRGAEAQLYADQRGTQDPQLSTLKLKKPESTQVTMNAQGGFVIVL